MAQCSNVTNDRSAAEVAPADPDYIVYLLDPEQEYNCYFVVGNPDLENTERIGVVKKMLLAHSLVLRAELQDSKIAEKNDVKVTDLFPGTFKNLLRYVYGYDNTSSLTFDEADNLLYAAEKYMMHKLKNALATLLISKLDYSNICSLMNNPACYTVLELNSAITEILQDETARVLTSSQFLDLSPYGFLKILEQEVLDVAEIDIWKAAVMWAKNRGNSEDGETLRNELTDHLKLIRFCTMTVEDMFYRVAPTKILSYDEVILISESHTSGEIKHDLTEVCNVVKERDQSNLEFLELDLFDLPCYQAMESSITLITEDVYVLLCSVQLSSHSLLAHQCDCKISVSKNREPPTVVRFSDQISADTNWTIPIVDNGKKVTLYKKSSYSVKISFSCSYNHFLVYNSSNVRTLSGKNISVEFTRRSSSGCYMFHGSKIYYKTKKERGFC